MNVSDWSVRGAKLDGNLLLFSSIEHCCAKKELKSSAFWRKSVIKLPLWDSGRIGGMIGIFYHSQNFLKWTNRFRASFWIRQFH